MTLHISSFSQQWDPLGITLPSNHIPTSVNHHNIFPFIYLSFLISIYSSPHISSLLQTKNYTVSIFPTLPSNFFFFNQKSRFSVHHYNGIDSTEVPVIAEVFQVHSRAKNASLHHLEVLCDSYKMEGRRPKL